MSEKRKISRATGILGIATGLSRIVGLVRDMVIAALFGAGFGTDAFFMAFTIPNLLRRFFAEGSLTAAFVPTFSDVYHREGREEALRLARICWTLLFLVMTAVTIAGVLGSPLIVRVIGFGFGEVEGKLGLTNFLNRLMFPYVFFVSLLALITGILNVFGHYFMPAFSTVFLNLAIILCGIFLSSSFDVPVTALAVGVLLGGAIQLLVQFPVLKKQGIHLLPSFNFRHPAVIRVARLMLPGIAGVAIYQINVVVTRLLASFLYQGSVSYLYYAQRLFEFPQGIFIVSLAQAVLPSMSRQAAMGEEEQFKESLRFGLTLILIVTLPAAAGLILCSVPVYSLFFMSAAFTWEDVQQTAHALAAYAPGLMFVGFSRIIVPSFYARGDTRTPVWISFWTLLVNALLGLILMGPFGHIGLAWALTLASVFNCLALIWALHRRTGRLGLEMVWNSLWKLILATGLMSLLVWRVLSYGNWQDPGGGWQKSGLLFAGLFGGMGLYGSILLLLKVPEAAEAVSFLRRKITGRAL